MNTDVHRSDIGSWIPVSIPSVARRRVVAGCLLAILVSVGFGGAAPALGSDDAKPEEIANAALDVLGSLGASPHNNYLVAICRGSDAAMLAGDTALGGFVRYLAKVKATMAVIVAPTGYSADPTYVVYFDGARPLGAAALEASDERITEEAIAKAYVPVKGPVAERKRRAAFTTRTMPLDEGAIEVLVITGWK